MGTLQIWRKGSEHGIEFRPVSYKFALKYIGEHWNEIQYWQYKTNKGMIAWGGVQ